MFCSLFFIYVCGTHKAVFPFLLCAVLVLLLAVPGLFSILYIIKFVNWQFLYVRAESVNALFIRQSPFLPSFLPC